MQKKYSQKTDFEIKAYKFQYFFHILENILMKESPKDIFINILLIL